MCYGRIGVVGCVEVCLDRGMLLFPRLTSFEPWTPQPSTVGENLRESEGIVVVTLTVVTIECFADPLFSPRDEIPRRKGGR